jgi:late competence protein required for DNA uptake (superfamily II DNA/RNA helicase)
VNDARTPEERFSCARCGTTAESLPVTWTCSVENGRRWYFCEDCARANLRAIEGRLDSSWW